MSNESSFLSINSSFFRAVFSMFSNMKTPVIRENTFLLWEPCTKNHSEVLPGFAKYLIDLGYHVSVLVEPERIKEGLFSRFQHPNLTLNKMSKKQIYKYFKNSDLKDVKGVIVTTVGKLCENSNYVEAYKVFNNNADKSKIFFVEHEAKVSTDAGRWKDDIIMLRKMNYKNISCVVVNPHYFGDIKITPKNKDITNFITIGALRSKRKNSQTIINAVQELHNRGITNFKVTVVGRLELHKSYKFPKELKRYFDIKGRLPFDKMYDEIEKADFMLTAYDKDNVEHQRYITTGTSGNFQLVYGFLKPCIIIDEFAPINGYNSENAILYSENSQYSEAMAQCIEMDSEKYSKMQENLKVLASEIYENSKDSLQTLIKKGNKYE